MNLMDLHIEHKNRQTPHVLSSTEGHGTTYRGKAIYEKLIKKGRKSKKSRHRRQVAVKRFPKHEPLDTEAASRYEKVVRDFRDAKINVPNNVFLAHLPKGTQIGKEVLERPEWVRVSPVSYRGKEGKLLKVGKKYTGPPNTRLSIVKQLSRVANAGYLPNRAIFESFRPEDPRSKAVSLRMEIPAREGKKSKNKRAEQLFKEIHGMALESNLPSRATPKVNSTMRSHSERFSDYIQDLPRTQDSDLTSQEAYEEANLRYKQELKEHVRTAYNELKPEMASAMFDYLSERGLLHLVVPDKRKAE
jgi:hypothetical protein